MLKKIQFAARYFKYWLNAKNQTKSKFVNSLIKEVFQSSNKFYAFKKIEEIRSSLKKNNSLVNITDFGAGSSINKSKKRKISDLVKNSAKAPWLGETLFRLINKFEPKNMIELGTSLGISACYQIGANKNVNFTTLEGCPETAKVAKEVLKNFKAQNVKVKVGSFSDTLSEVIQTYEELDYVFFDGNHKKAPTIEYFNMCLKKAHENSIFVFDDIHWSTEMEEAWEYVQSHPSVTCRIDIFWMGIVFFKKDQPKRTFIIR